MGTLISPPVTFYNLSQIRLVLFALFILFILDIFLSSIKLSLEAISSVCGPSSPVSVRLLSSHYLIQSV